MHSIHWPQGFIPGFSDNFASNEIIITGLDASEVWRWLTQTSVWESYYSNVSDIVFHDASGPTLTAGSRFRFTTFSFPVEAEVVEFAAPQGELPGRLAWHGWVGNEDSPELDVHHAWLIENLPSGRVRILTQETQNGQPARELAGTLPNPMLNAHQEWICGLANYALSQKK